VDHERGITGRSRLIVVLDGLVQGSGAIENLGFCWGCRCVVVGGGTRGVEGVQVFSQVGALGRRWEGACLSLQIYQVDSTSYCGMLFTMSGTFSAGERHLC